MAAAANIDLTSSPVVRCSATGCTHECEPGDMPAHVRECGWVVDACTHGCGMAICKKDMQTHAVTECSETQLPCNTPAFNGEQCKYVGPRRTLAEHHIQCMLRRADCQSCHAKLCARNVPAHDCIAFLTSELERERQERARERQEWEKDRRLLETYAQHALNRVANVEQHCVQWLQAQLDAQLGAAFAPSASGFLQAAVSGEAPAPPPTTTVTLLPATSNVGGAAENNTGADGELEAPGDHRRSWSVTLRRAAVVVVLCGLPILLAHAYLQCCNEGVLGRVEWRL